MNILSNENRDYLTKILLLAQELPKADKPEELTSEQALCVGFLQGVTSVLRGGFNGSDS